MKQIADGVQMKGRKEWKDQHRTVSYSFKEGYYLLLNIYRYISLTPMAS